jgi:thiaminase (transcriptional activator TenA)
VAFTDELWDSAADVYAAVRAHPFLTGLTDGTLPHAAFGHFVVQDSHYLRGYARALAVLAARAPTEDDTTLFAQHAAGAIAAEQEMHAALADALDSDRSDTPALPTTLAYTSYLLATCHGGSFAEGLGAVLPCYWIYARVGEALLAESSPDPLYARWIAMYGGEEFRAVVDAALGVMDRVAPDLAPVERDRVVGHYRTTSRYEWMFWDAAWRQECWPV